MWLFISICQWSCRKVMILVVSVCLQGGSGSHDVIITYDERLCSGRSRIFLGGGQLPKLVCMKMKEFKPPRGASLAPPLDLPLQTSLGLIFGGYGSMYSWQAGNMQPIEMLSCLIPPSSLICMSTQKASATRCHLEHQSNPGNLPSGHCQGPLKKAHPKHALHFMIN